MSSNKIKFVLSLILGVFLLGIASACISCPQECVPQTYDSCYICMNTGLNPSTGLSNYIVQLSGDSGYYEMGSNTVCGVGFYDIDSGTGIIKLKTPSLPFTGNYTFRFYYGIGTPNDIGTEDFTVKCGGKTYTFLDNDDVGTEDEFRFAEVQCQFNSGYNYVEFRSTNIGSVHFKKFKITGELTCPPPAPVCGNGVKETGEACDDGNTNNLDSCKNDCTLPTCGDQVCSASESCSGCPQDCGICPPVCGDGQCNGQETCETCPCDCGTCPPVPYCGDGIVNQGSEECDAGAQNGVLCIPGYGSSCDYCSDNCALITLTDGYCGDGIKQSLYEECDDGNTNNGDGCDSSCNKENNDKEKTKKSVEILDVCNPNWKCSGWSECYDNIMTRDCVDENHCDIEYNKPAEQSICKSLLPAKVEPNNNTLWLIIGIIILVILLIILIGLLR
jgi:cysteine-rich repeat protein